MALFGRKAKTASPVVDLRDPAPAPAKPEFGFPTQCPECGSPGYLDSIDVGKHVMYQHCPTCWHRWETTEAEITAES